MTLAAVNVEPIDRYLAQLWARGATDLHLTAGARPLLRIDGDLVPLEEEPVLTGNDTSQLVLGVLGETLRAQLREHKEIDFAFSWGEEARFRANCFFQNGTMAMALRAIPMRIPTFAELGLPAACRHFADLSQGLVLVTGPTGSGKSTTIASMLDFINEHRACHILTIEDPVEYVHRHRRSIVNQREVGWDTDGFPQALRAALREDPDVIMVGEMRDPETIQFALTIAETGHLVFATLHTNDAAQALDRISDVFPAQRQDQVRVQLAASVAGVLAQRLLPRRGGGLVAAFEVLVANSAVRSLVREGKTHQIRNVIAGGRQEGMVTLESSLSDLVSAGLVSHEEAVSRSLYPREIKATGA